MLLSPDFSIVVPSYNQADYIARTLESLLSQDGATLEILVQDGGSTDGTLDILKSYGDRIHWVSGPDGGQTQAINQGLKWAKGQWLGYLNSDDVLLPGALATVKNCFLENRQADFVYGLARRIDAQDRPLADYPVRPWDPAAMKETCFISQPACFWRQETLGKLGAFNESLRFSMDYDFWIRGVEAGLEFVYLPSPLAAARIHGGAKTMSQRRASFEESFATMRRHYPGYVSRRWILALAQVRAEEHLVGALHNPLAWLNFLKNYMGNARALAREHHFGEPLKLGSTLIPKSLNTRKRLSSL